MHSSRSEVKLDWVHARAATYAVKRWHYSRTMPKPPLSCIGVWESGKFIGVIIFSRGASPNLGTPYGVSKTEVCELTRVALTRHKTPVSRLISIAVRMLRKKDPGLMLIISFADPMYGHHGGIYQAGNWLFAGKTPDSPMYLAPDGKLWHSRCVTARGKVWMYNKLATTWKPSQCQKITAPGKYRYLMPLDEGLRRRLAEKLPKMQYPKRGGSETVDTSGHPPEKGGSTPTPPLHQM